MVVSAGRRSTGEAIPEGFLPVFAVSTKAEADLLTVKALAKGYMRPTPDRSWVGVAVELAEMQDLERLAAFSRQLQECHDEIVAEGRCECDPSWWEGWIARERDTDGLYVHCLECDTYTEAEDGEDTPCAMCDSEGMDPYCTELVRIEPCPTPGGDCASEDHHWGRGDHVIDAT